MPVADLHRQGGRIRDLLFKAVYIYVIVAKSLHLCKFHNCCPFFFIHRNPHPDISMVTISSVPPLRRFVYSAFSGIQTVFG